MLIRDTNWSQVEATLKTDGRAVVPLGSTEQHAGLSLAVDSILSERVAAEAAATRSGCRCSPRCATGSRPMSSPSRAR